MSVARIQLRRDTAANWTSANTILNLEKLVLKQILPRQKLGTVPLRGLA